MEYGKLVVLIPAYNEENTIFKVIKDIPSIVNLKQEIIVIDDGSTDSTFKQAKHTDATIISNKKNLGLGFTFKYGLINSLKHGADIIAILDGDGQYNPKNLESLIFPILNNQVDLVIGNRFLYETVYELNFMKKLGNKLLSIFLSKILLRLDQVYDIQSSYRAFNRKIAKFLVRNLKGNYNYAQEMFILCCLYGFIIKQIPVECYKRNSGKSRLIKNPIIYLFKIFWVIFKTYLKIKIKLL
ncbi:MAG: glycosyltransferase family 2 protein [Candidatus Odinarchaeota archaeon]